MSRGVTTYWVGDFSGAEGHLAHAAELYDPDYARSLSQSFSADVTLRPHCYRIWCLLQVGQHDQAKALCRRVKELAGDLSSSYATATALHYETMLALHLGEVELTRERAEELIALSDEQQFSLFWATGTGAHGWALAQQGDLEQGIAELERSIAVFDRMGAMVGRGFWLSCIVDGFLKHQRTADGLRRVEEALSFQGLSRYYDAEIVRLKGELLLLEGRHRDAAKGCFLEALGMAQGQGAKMLELRAVMSLGRQLAEEGDPGHARAVLSQACESSTEYVNCRELGEARALLESLD